MRQKVYFLTIHSVWTTISIFCPISDHTDGRVSDFYHNRRTNIESRTIFPKLETSLFVVWWAELGHVVDMQSFLTYFLLNFNLSVLLRINVIVFQNERIAYATRFAYRIVRD